MICWRRWPVFELEDRASEAMTEINPDDGSKRAKNIAAVLYLIVLVFLVGGSYLNQPASEGVEKPSSAGR